MKKITSEKDLKPVKEEPPKPYMIYTRFRYTPPEGVDIELDRSLTEFEMLQLKVISTGEISEIELGAPGDSYYGKATFLKVYLDDGDSSADDSNSFNIVLKFIPDGEDADVLPGILNGFIYQNKANQILSENSSAERKKDWDEIDKKISNIQVTDEELADVDLESLFATGSSYTITPYVKDDMFKYIEYMNSDSALKTYFEGSSTVYFNIVDSYYSGKDSGIASDAEEPDMSNVKNPVFLFM